MSYIEKVLKFITIEKNNAASIQNFIREMQTLNVYDELNKSIDSNPEHNYKVLLKSIKDSKDKCLPKKVVKYNKKKHKKSKWMTSALLKSIDPSRVKINSVSKCFHCKWVMIIILQYVF